LPHLLYHDMKKTITFISFFFFALVAMGQIINPNYDENLAKKLNADELGMKMYVLVILKSGSSNITDKHKRDSLFAGHFANINRLADLKKLVVAGPLDKNEQKYRGIFILDVTDIEEAKILLESDPTISEKVFDAEYFQWYGSAALPEYLDVSDKIWRKKP